MLKLNKKEIENVINLPGGKRYKYFIGRVADIGKMWGLYDNGWALAGGDAMPLIALWPAPEYARLCAVSEWQHYKPMEVGVHDFLDKHLEDLKKDKIGLAIFYTPADNGVVPTYEKFENDLRYELSRIE
ncbi:MAG: DUF2750 domain-containing protein [Alphaproteobacteria bacterium]